MGKEKKVAIIGAGLGGLSAALRLANSGFDVHIFEQNSKAGGKAGEISENGFRFDSGPSLITMPFVIEELLSDIDENISEYFSMIPLSNLCKYHFKDGTIINSFTNKKTFPDEIEKNTLDKSDKVVEYLNYCKNIYELTAELFLFKS
jgi:diapolycopene oxygenase